MYSLGLNNPPRICLHLESHSSKIYDVTNRGTVHVKLWVMQFAKLHSQMPWIATTGRTPWQTAVNWTADCQDPRSDC
jgi:hypothetical protein